jgi:hypothetical protein
MATTSALVTTTGGNVYTSSGNTVITWLSLTNYSGSDVTANVHILPSGGSANTQNIVVANVAITAGDSLQLYVGNEKLILENSTTVYANCNVDSRLNAVTSYTSA